MFYCFQSSVLLNLTGMKDPFLYSKTLNLRDLYLNKNACIIVFETSKEILFACIRLTVQIATYTYSVTAMLNRLFL